MTESEAEELNRLKERVNARLQARFNFGDDDDGR